MRKGQENEGDKYSEGIFDHGDLELAGLREVIRDLAPPVLCVV